MSKIPAHTVVIGGGVIGATCAYYLAKAGGQVTIIDRGDFGRACSHGNCGYVSPSHVLPLAQPGVVRRSLQAMLNKHSPFYIKPRLSPALWHWLWSFWRRCNARDMLESGRAIHTLLQSSRSLYDDLMRDEQFDCDWETQGILFVHYSRASFDHFDEVNNLLTKEFGVSAEPYPGAALTALEPALKPGLGGGWLYAIDAHLRSDRLMPAWKAALARLGVTVREQCACEGFEREGDRAVAVRTSHGRVAADAFIVATGAWTPFLQTELGCRIPIQPGKGYSITMPRPRICPKYPLLLEEHRVAITPWKSGYRIGSTMEFSGYDTALNRGRLGLLKRGAELYLQEPYTEPVLEEWYGWRPMTYDSRPIIDFAPRFRNVVIAAGHNMLGLSMATGTGKLVAELLSGETPHLDPRPFAATRF